MSPLEYVGWACVVLAILIQLLVGRRFVKLFDARYHAFPTWRWLFTPDHDAEVERWRRYASAAPILAITGLVVLAIAIITSPSPPAG